MNRATCQAKRGKRGSRVIKYMAADEAINNAENSKARRMSIADAGSGRLQLESQEIGSLFRLLESGELPCRFVGQ